MELIKLHKLILTPFAADTVKLLRQMAGVHGHIGKAYGDDPEKFGFAGYAVCMVSKLHTLTEGKFLLHLPAEAAITLGNRIREKLYVEPFDVEIIDENIGEAWVEFANTLVNLATQRLQHSQAPMTFSLPITVTNARDLGYLMEGVNEVITLPIEIEGGARLHLSFLLHDRTH